MLDLKLRQGQNHRPQWQESQHKKGGGESWGRCKGSGRRAPGKILDRLTSRWRVRASGEEPRPREAELGAVSEKDRPPGSHSRKKKKAHGGWEGRTLAHPFGGKRLSASGGSRQPLSGGGEEVVSLLLRKKKRARLSRKEDYRSGGHHVKKSEVSSEGGKRKWCARPAQKAGCCEQQERSPPREKRKGGRSPSEKTLRAKVMCALEGGGGG